MSFENNRAEADATVVDASIVDEINPKTFDEAAIREHISLVHKAAEGAEGVLVLCVFGENPLTGRSEKFPPAEKFAIGEVDEMVAAVMRLERRSQANVYLGLHVMRRDLPAKARGGLKDLTAVLGLVADFDDGAGAEGIGNMRARGLAPSYIIESSPRNAQAFLIFDRPMPPQDAMPLAEALKMAAPLSDSGTKDIAHVWRVPGCRNWPNKKKVDGGRPREPAQVKILQSDSGKRYSPDELRTLLAAELTALEEAEAKAKADASADKDAGGGDEIDEPALPQGLINIISAGVARGHRSERFHHVVCQLKERFSASADAIEQLLSKYPTGIAEKYAGDLRKHIDACYAKADERGSKASTAGYVLGANDKPVANVANVLTAMRTEPALKEIVAFDEMLVAPILVRPLQPQPGFAPRPATDADVTAVQEFLQRKMLPSIGLPIMWQAFYSRARNECAYHPVRDYLQALTWDRTPRIGSWLSTYAGAEQTPYIEKIGTMFLLSMMRG